MLMVKLGQSHLQVNNHKPKQSMINKHAHKNYRRSLTVEKRDKPFSVEVFLKSFMEEVHFELLTWEKEKTLPIPLSCTHIDLPIWLSASSGLRSSTQSRNNRPLCSPFIHTWPNPSFLRGVFCDSQTELGHPSMIASCTCFSLNQLWFVTFIIFFIFYFLIFKICST